MSDFCGKCDLADCFNGYDDERIANSEFYIYIDGKDHRLDIHCRKDLIPYYPFLISSMGASKEKTICHITSESFIDREEKEHLGWILRDAIKYYKKCKRKKIKYKEEEALTEISLWRNPGYNEREIVRRVGVEGANATIEGLHDYIHDIYRKRLYEEMVDAGYKKEYAFKWCFGWERFFDLYRKGMTIDEFFTEIK